MAVAAWITLTLKQLGAPTNDLNVQALLAWAASEGMPASANNPLAASDQIAGAKPTPGYSEPTYPSAQAAATLYVAKLTSATYANVGDALRQGTSLQSIWFAINQSPWCAGCQAGHYPAVLWNEVKAPGSTQAPVTAPHTTGAAQGIDSRQVGAAWSKLMRTLAITAPDEIRRVRAARGRIRKAVS